MVLNGYYSNWSSDSGGVPVLEPLRTISLATVYVNSLPSNVTSLLLMFANDSYHEDDIQINSE